MIILKHIGVNACRNKGSRKFNLLVKSLEPDPKRADRNSRASGTKKTK